MRPLRARQLVLRRRTGGGRRWLRRDAPSPGSPHNSGTARSGWSPMGAGSRRGGSGTARPGDGDGFVGGAGFIISQGQPLCGCPSLTTGNDHNPLDSGLRRNDDGRWRRLRRGVREPAARLHPQTGRMNGRALALHLRNRSPDTVADRARFAAGGGRRSRLRRGRIYAPRPSFGMGDEAAVRDANAARDSFGRRLRAFARRRNADAARTTGVFRRPEIPLLTFRAA